MATADLKIPVEQLRRRCDPFIFEFESTADIPPLDDAIGQERAVRAIAQAFHSEEYQQAALRS